MKKTYKLENLDCANCAAKMERGISRLPGVKRATVNFMTSRLTLEADEGSFDELVKQAQGVCRRIEPDCKIIA